MFRTEKKKDTRSGVLKAYAINILLSWFKIDFIISSRYEHFHTALR